jgi:hypothetical protein
MHDSRLRPSGLGYGVTASLWLGVQMNRKLRVESLELFIQQSVHFAW